MFPACLEFMIHLISYLQLTAKTLTNNNRDYRESSKLIKSIRMIWVVKMVKNNKREFQKQQIIRV